MNGLYTENILVRDDDDIYVPFEYEFMRDVPINPHKNIIIDSRYEKILFREIYRHGIDVLIFNTTRHKVINVYQFFEDIMGISKVTLSINKIKKICLIMFILKNFNIKIDIKYILQNIDSSDFQKMDIITNMSCICDCRLKITSEKYNIIKNKLLNFEEVHENQSIQKSFIVLFGNEIVKVS